MIEIVNYHVLYLKRQYFTESFGTGWLDNTSIARLERQLDYHFQVGNESRSRVVRVSSTRKLEGVRIMQR